MPFDMRFPKGSEWRKWDLHIHSPATVFNNQFDGADDNEKWTNYFNKLSSLTGVAVLGITDYFSIRGFRKVKEHKDAGNLGNISLILPNVELRILPVTGTDTPINLHIVFSDEIIEDLDSKFFSELKFDYLDEPFRCLEEDLIKLGRKFRNDEHLGNEAAYQVGVEQFKTDLKTLKEIFSKSKIIRDNALVIVSNSSNDGNSGIQRSSLLATRQDIYRFADAIFSGNPNDRKYFLGKGVDDEKEIVRKYGSLKPCVHGSDAHSNDKICNPDLGRFTWVKADPTFEGLRQILFEPDERVQIQTASPADDFRKSQFTHLKSGAGEIIHAGPVRFDQVDLPLNENLVAIIGGRGTGKSLLLDSLAKTFGKLEGSERKDVVTIDADFEVTYAKPDRATESYQVGVANRLDYLHVHQGQIKSIVKDRVKFDGEIKKLLLLPEAPFDSGLEEEIRVTLSRMSDLRSWFGEKDSQGRLINSEETIRAEIEDKRKLIDALSTEASKELISQYNDTSLEISEARVLISNTNVLEQRLVEFVDSINKDFEGLNTRLSTTMQIPTITVEVQLAALKKVREQKVAEIASLQEKNRGIEQSFADAGIKEDITTLFEKLATYQQEIGSLNSRLNEITSKRAEYANLLSKRKEFGSRIREHLQRNAEEVDRRWEKLKEGKEGWLPDQRTLISSLLTDIDIAGEIVFDPGQFYQTIMPALDGRRFRPQQKLEQVFGMKTIDDYFELIADRHPIATDDGNTQLEQFIGQAYFTTEGPDSFIEALFTSAKRNEYLRVLSKVSFRGKTPEKLSVGQKGTLYVCLKLATDPFITPFVFDQPEDDLDNDFIMQHLVPIFRRIKKYRQVIIVTHNANLVVNADAEQVLVAHNEGEVLRYVSGSLENCFGPVEEVAETDPLRRKGIRQHICDILEGGRAAFEKREQKYGFR